MNLFMSTVDESVGLHWPKPENVTIAQTRGEGKLKIYDGNNMEITPETNLCSSLKQNQFQTLGLVGEEPGEVELTVRYGNDKIVIAEDKVMVSVLDVELIPDYDRNGKIDDADRKMLAQGTPFRFWVNDDNDASADSEGTGGNDLPGQRIRDGNDFKVNGIRDLIDFFPIFIDAKNAVKAYPFSEYFFRLKHAGQALGGFETDLTPGKCNKYLTDLDEATKDKDKNSPFLAIAELTEGFLNKIRTGTGGIVLIEAKVATEKPLLLEIVRRSDNRVIYTKQLPIRISQVEEMFRHKNLRSVPTGSDKGGAADRPHPSNIPATMDEDKYLVWVHGYNNDGDQARATFAEVFKRLFWSGYKGKFYPVSWYGDPPAVPLLAKHYHNAVINAFASAKPLADFVNSLGANTCVFGHSLGNMVVGASINDHNLRCKKYFAVDSAVALESYNAGESREDSMIALGDDTDSTSWKIFKDPPYDQLMASEWYKLFNDTNDHRKELTWRGRFANVGDGVNGTEVFNFYSGTEEVLRKYEGNSVVLEGGTQFYCWVKQEKFKGTGNFLAGLAGGSNDFCGWGFNMLDNDEDGSPLYYNLNEDEKPYVKQPDELSLDSYDLVHQPFFKPYPRELFQDGASHLINATIESQPEICAEWIVKNATVRDWLLAKAFPALTLPMGANPNNAENWKKNNFDMLPSFATSQARWPRTETEEGREKPVWFHSDYKDIAYQHVHKFYEKIVDLTK